MKGCYGVVTLLREGHRSWRMMGREEGPFVSMERGPSVAELELDVGRGEVREPRGALVEAPWRQVHGEAAHLARGPEERAAAHRSQLLQTALFGAFVLEPHLGK